MKRWIYSLTLLILALHPTGGIRANVFADVHLDRNSVYVQQPFRVTITVYTTTWFTAPLEFGNLQIPNTFIVPFSKTQPGMFSSGSKQYPGVQFYFIVFPYKVGEFTVPPLEISAQSPPEGSSTAQKIMIHTKEQKFMVRDVPEKLKESGTWFVAKNVQMHQTWTPDLKDLKVGDVIKQTITIEAQGTLPQFIPDLTGSEKVKWASTYPQEPVLTDTRNDADANGRSSQTITFLLEKKGDYKIPAIKLSYWNPYTNKIMTETAPEIQIHVKDNPNLGILTTLKDSLSATQKTTATATQKKGPLLILGMHWYYFLLIVIIGTVLLYFLVRTGIRVSDRLKKRRQIYLKSEDYHFHQLMKTDEHSRNFLKTLYEWWDSVKYKPSASVKVSLEEEGKADEASTVQSYLTSIYSGQKPENEKKLKNSLKKIREEINHTIAPENNKLNDTQKPWE